MTLSLVESAEMPRKKEPFLWRIAKATFRYFIYRAPYTKVTHLSSEWGPILEEDWAKALLSSLYQTADYVSPVVIYGEER